ncbi:endo-1,3;1,4-beta-D-glucanase-like [Vicia villosa]|uniref:endo-1,3;1,4-beta-D-glucanase-like n=1 Tax=Vicia villosa TaxID=3911 RepID=UPI00273B0E24|nr:endo-1,3;1,4-beta-D-glucanase-like [Vicia villosa]
MSGPECCSNPPTLNPSAGSGHVEKIGALNAYIAGSPNSNPAVLFASDIFGYEAPKFRKLADKVAAAGYYVVVPDFLNGEPYNPENPNRPMPVWIKDHGTDKGFEDAKLIIEAIKSKGVASVGAAGFCWGAKVVTELAKSKLIEAVVLLHPSFVSLDDIKGVDIPISILGAEIDLRSPPELVKQFEETLTANSVTSFVKIFPKVSHGWTVRYKPEDAEEVKAAEEAHQDLLNWFAKYLK